MSKNIKRIIPCLDVKNFRTVKGVNFENLRDAGDAIELARYYSEQGADELTFLDISATEEERGTFVDFVAQVAAEINIPFTVGGGISQVSDMAKVFQAGADKIGINSAAVRNPDLINQGAAEFGCQAIVVAIDVKRVGDKFKIFVSGGEKETEHELVPWITEVQKRGAGEILLTSMDCDGVKTGFDLEVLELVKAHVSVPIIASGGAGSAADFIPIFESNLADAGLAASIFHFGEVTIPDLKTSLDSAGVPVRI